MAAKKSERTIKREINGDDGRTGKVGDLSFLGDSAASDFRKRYISTPQDSERYTVEVKTHGGEVLERCTFISGMLAEHDYRMVRDGYDSHDGVCQVTLWEGTVTNPYGRVLESDRRGIPKGGRGKERKRTV